MPTQRPSRTTEAAPPPVTIDRADVAGMTAGEAHEAILGAFDAGVLTATAATGMIDQAVIDATVAELADARKVCASHSPYTLTTGDPGTWCLTEGADGPPWPCPTYRTAAALIADGLSR